MEEPDDHRIDFDSVRLFLRVVEQGSFTAAARRSGLPLTSVSRRVKALEQALGVQLLHRTTRRIVVTEAGRAFYTRCLEAEHALLDATQSTRDLRGQARGTLHVMLPYTLGLLAIEPRLAQFRHQHPQVQLALTYSNHPLDLLTHGIDVAIHVGALTDSSYVARPLGISRAILMASKAYLKRHGTPAHPRELAHHAILSMGVEAPLVTWSLRHERGDSLQATVRPVLISNESTTLIRQALQGAGIVLLSRQLATPHLHEGSLVQVLPGWQRWPDAEIHALYAQRATQDRKVRAFVEFLEDTFAHWRVAGH